jgi:arginyl-tRNA synthetase
MLERAKQELASLAAEAIRRAFGVEHEPVVEIPPRRDLGDLALPAGLHLARVLKRPPRAVAEGLLAQLALPAWAREARVEGAGYLNVFLDRGAAAAALLAEPVLPQAAGGVKVVVEHTNINPNKAAHIGHLRNAVLGDVLARVLRRLGDTVEVQNYIDDTGVQLADVVVGFRDLEGASLAEVAALPEPFDFTCWDLYAEVGRWYAADEERLACRRETLHELERGTGERAELGRLIARRVLARHLATMARLGIGYDLLTHESAVLALDFFAEAFARLEERGAVRLEAEGKNAGCWVMPLADKEEFEGLEDPDKVIVRSDGTVTYVGKDIAYQLWKFGLLARDFAYRLWPEAGVWQTVAADGTSPHPAFGHGERVINVIDARQSYLQKIVRAGLEALGYPEQAAASRHFAYEMVALSASTARELGFLGEDEEAGGAGLEMSGRKGIGVKADDLMDRLEAKSREEIAARNRELPDEEVAALAREIAVAALRFFMAKASTTRVIAFDLGEALSFEGDSGPYLQYALVRVRNIRRKLQAAGLPDDVAPERLAALPAGVWTEDLWDLVLAVGQIPDKVRAVGESLEVSLLARHALDLAQRFNAVYHRHPILHEPDPDLRDARLGATLVFAKGLETLCELLGLPIPERM